MQKTLEQTMQDALAILIESSHGNKCEFGFCIATSDLIYNPYPFYARIGELCESNVFACGTDAIKVATECALKAKQLDPQLRIESLRKQADELEANLKA